MNKIWGFRSSLIGDSVLSLCVLNYIKTIIPDSYINFCIDKSCSQAAPLYLNHPQIDRIKITDIENGYGELDYKIINDCDIVFNCTPPQTDFYWFNKHNTVKQAWIMSGLDAEIFDSLKPEDQKPRLYQWWPEKKQDGTTIALWPFAHYGGHFTRNPSKEFWSEFVSELIKLGYTVIQYGWHNEPPLYNNGGSNYFYKCGEPLINSIQESLSCSLIVGVNTGPTWALSSYHKIKQVTLIRNEIENGHISCKLAHAPVGEKCFNFLVEDSWNNLSITDFLGFVINVLENS